MNPTPATRPPQSNRLLALALTSVFAFAGFAPAAAAGGPGEVPLIPDLARGGTKDDTHAWNLGPTGIRGWIYGRQGHTVDARQILVTAVAKSSPADGILNSGDVILGAGGGYFSGDARIQFANAITAAEEKSGVLRLTRWRDGQSAAVDLKLPVLGAYSGTAPYNCPKSKKIFEQGCRLIAKNGLGKADIPIDLNALALLASGNKEYHPMLAEYAKKVAASLHPGVWTWYYGSTREPFPTGITSHGPAMRTMGNARLPRCSSTCWATVRHHRISPGWAWPAMPSGNGDTPETSSISSGHCPACPAAARSPRAPT